MAIFDRTACHHAPALTSTGDGNSRPWTIPRLLGYGAAMGVKLKITPWQEDGMITCSLA